MNDLNYISSSVEVYSTDEILLVILSKCSLFFIFTLKVLSLEYVNKNNPILFPGRTDHCLLKNYKR
jgi:hypothetical protein